MSGGMKRLFLFVLLCSLFIFTVDPTGNLLDVCEAFVFSLPEGTEITLLVQCCLFQKYQCPEERLTSQVNRGRKHPQIHVSWQNSKPRGSYDPYTCGDHSEEKAVLGQNQLLT